MLLRDNAKANYLKISRTAANDAEFCEKMMLVILSIYATVAQNFRFAGNSCVGVHFTSALSAYDCLIF